MLSAQPVHGTIYGQEVGNDSTELSLQRSNRSTWNGRLGTIPNPTASGEPHVLNDIKNQSIIWGPYRSASWSFENSAIWETMSVIKSMGTDILLFASPIFAITVALMLKV